jgi:hypothetical protein
VASLGVSQGFSAIKEARMGWYRIDPETGQPLQDHHSALSRPPDFVLLNAVPGEDDEEVACYFGDGPSDMGFSFTGEVREMLPSGASLSPDEVRGLLLGGKVPARLGAISGELRQAVKAFWADIDGCYEDDWDRRALETERRWVCESVVERFCNEE